jgi:hypothetical protein
MTGRRGLEVRLDSPGRLQGERARLPTTPMGQGSTPEGERTRCTRVRRWCGAAHGALLVDDGGIRWIQGCSSHPLLSPIFLLRNASIGSPGRCYWAQG